MAQEIESKFRLSDAGALRQRLAASGAQRIDAVHETNLILDNAARLLLGRGCGLRVRLAEPLDGAGPRRATLTYKGPRDADLHARGIRAREEIETDVEDERRLVAVLARLGFAPVLRYEKRRETWRVPISILTGPVESADGPAGGEAEVVLDELPQLGWFAEIEAPSSEVLESLCRHLELDPASASRETYPELTARLGKPEPDGSRSLQF